MASGGIQRDSWECGQEGMKTDRKVYRMVGRQEGRYWRDRQWWAPPDVHLNKRLSFKHCLLVEHESCAVPLPHP